MIESSQPPFCQTDVTSSAFSEVYLMDCIEGMKHYPDKYFDLAIVDPPYGIGASSVKFINGTSKTVKPYYKENCWDTERPTEEYFNELKRVSKNQIVWGGNYFADYLGAFRCGIAGNGRALRCCPSDAD